MVARAAWVLNFDAEDELRVGPTYAPPNDMRPRLHSLRERVRALTGDDAVFVDPDGPPPTEAAGLVGYMWCPTPRAIAALDRAGTVRAPTPSVDVVRRVNDRRFHHALGAPLAGSRWMTNAGEILALTAGGRWLLKRALGFAGRGRLACGEGVDARSFVARAIREDGGVAVEPHVEVLLDVSIHGYLDAAGSLTLGRPVASQIKGGTWQGVSETPPDLLETEVASLVSDATSTAAALTREGYFGPFNLDAFRYVDRDGNGQFCPRCEINARFSMGFGAGWGRFPGVPAGRSSAIIAR